MVGRTKKGVALLFFPGRYPVRETLANQDMYIDERQERCRGGNCYTEKDKSKGVQPKENFGVEYMIYNICL